MLSERMLPAGQNETKLGRAASDQATKSGAQLPPE